MKQLRSNAGREGGRLGSNAMDSVAQSSDAPNAADIIITFMSLSPAARTSAHTEVVNQVAANDCTACPTEEWRDYTSRRHRDRARETTSLYARSLTAEPMTTNL